MIPSKKLAKKFSQAIEPHSRWSLVVRDFVWWVSNEGNGLVCWRACLWAFVYCPIYVFVFVYLRMSMTVCVCVWKLHTVTRRHFQRYIALPTPFLCVHKHNALGFRDEEIGTQEQMSCLPPPILYPCYLIRSKQSGVKGRKRYSSYRHFNQMTPPIAWVLKINILKKSFTSAICAHTEATGKEAGKCATKNPFTCLHCTWRPVSGKRVTLTSVKQTTCSPNVLLVVIWRSAAATTFFLSLTLTL